MKIKLLEYYRTRKKYDLDVKLTVLLNLVVAVEAVLTLLSTLFVMTSASRCWYWLGVLVASIYLAELVMSERWRKLATTLTVYTYSLVLIPLWAIVHGSIALSGVIYIVTILLVLNMLASKVQRWIINPFMLIFMVAFLSHQYYTLHYIVVLPVEGELAVYYIVIIPVVMMVAMAVVTLMTDAYKKEHALLEEKNKELERMMRIDMLTGLYNKQFLNEQIKIFMSISRRNEVPLSVLVIDIDFFKNYNDMYGHIQGDNCLMKVAKTINDSVMRDSDSVFRFGGEEFVVLLHGVMRDNAEMLGQRIVDNVSNAKIKNIGSEVSKYLTVSVGLYTYDGKKDMTTNSVIRMADEALYNAKNSGRNRLCTI